MVASGAGLRIVTERLRLVALTPELYLGDGEGNDALSRLLNAEVPAEWPLLDVAEARTSFGSMLELHQDAHGWLSWYVILRRKSPAREVLVGSAGFFGPPVNGLVEIGYSVLPGYRRRGYATEAASALLEWAFGKANVDSVVAETDMDNVASQGVLAKLGFVAAEAPANQGCLRYELYRSPCRRRPNSTPGANGPG